MDLYEQLDRVARVDQVPLSEVLRRAATDYVVVRHGDPQFQQRLASLVNADRQALDRSAAGINVAAAIVGTPSRPGVLGAAGSSTIRRRPHGEPTPGP